ncbi:MAG: hypothetical protein IH993_08745, partial [Proteobacteria bacterium]|nr:hypothetical protein [Pseudomonadota bacterium]
MKNMKFMMLVILIAAIAGLLSLAGGCGGGASEVPTVVVKPAEPGADAADNGPSDNGNGNGDTPAEGYGTFTGRVLVKGTLKPRAALVLKGKAPRDPTVCAADGTIPDESVEGKNGGLKNVFIYLRKAPKNGKDHAGHEQKEDFDQKGCRFDPRAMIVRTKTPIIVKNSDPANHNVKIKSLFTQPFN